MYLNAHAGLLKLRPGLEAFLWAVLEMLARGEDAKSKPGQKNEDKGYDSDWFVSICDKYYKVLTGRMLGDGVSEEAPQQGSRERHWAVDVEAEQMLRNHPDGANRPNRTASKGPSRNTTEEWC